MTSIFNEVRRDFGRFLDDQQVSKQALNSWFSMRAESEGRRSFTDPTVVPGMNRSKSPSSPPGSRLRLWSLGVFALALVSSSDASAISGESMELVGGPAAYDVGPAAASVVLPEAFLCEVAVVYGRPDPAVGDRTLPPPGTEVSLSPKTELASGPEVGAASVAGAPCNNPGDPGCDGRCDGDDSGTGPDCDGRCDSGDSSFGPDCDGNCDIFDSSSGPDCDGRCDFFDSGSGPDCDGFCFVGVDAPNGPDCAPPVPAELVTFYGEGVGCALSFAWVTATENGVDYFSVEALRGGRFVEVLRQDARGGSHRTEYEAAYAAAPSGDEIFRLATRDLDGTTEYSDVVSIGRRGCTGDYTFHSPIDADYLTLAPFDLGAGRGSIRVIGLATGQVFPAIAEPSGSGIRIATHQLPLGTYVLEVTTGGRRRAHRFTRL